MPRSENNGLDAGGSWPVPDLRAFLTGGWRLDRRIRDRRTGLDGRFEGVARFVPEGPDLRGVETGRLTLGGHAGEAEQVYVYAFPEPGRAEVRFRDGRPFHDLDLRSGRWRAVHPCGADLYRGRFRACGPDAWGMVWRVAGPRKALSIASRFRRCG